MKNKKIVKIATLSLLLAPMVLGSLQGVSANDEKQARTSLREVDQENINLTLHKLQMSQLPENPVQNTGDIMDLDLFGEGVKGLPGVDFKIYNITDAYYLWQSKHQDNTAAVFQELVRTGEVEVVNGGNNISVGGQFIDTETVIKPPSYTDFTNNDGEVSIELPKKTYEKDSAFLILEDYHPGEVVGKAAPMFLLLPLFNLNEDGNPEGPAKQNIHLYPKNVLQTGEFQISKYRQTVDGKEQIGGAKFIIHNRVLGTGEEILFLGKLDEETGLRPWIHLSEPNAENLIEVFTNEDLESNIVEFKNLANRDYYLSEIDSVTGSFVGSNMRNIPFTIGGDDPTPPMELINDDVDVDKDNEGKDYEYGEEINYTVRTTVPKAIGEKYTENGVSKFRYTSFTLRDAHSSALAYIEDSLDFWVGDSFLEFEEGVDYELEVDEENHELKVSFIISDESKILDLAGETLTLEYAMKIVADSPADEDFNNKVYGKTEFVDYDKNVGNDEDDDDGEDVYTGGKKFVKIDIDTEKPLSGAKFYVTRISDEIDFALYKDVNGDYEWDVLPSEDVEAPEGLELVVLESSEDEANAENHGRF